MMKKSFNIGAYLRGAEVAHSNYDGFGDFEFDDMPDYAQATGGGVNMVKQNTPYQINVTNNTTTDGTLVLFGTYKYLLTANFGSSVGLTVTPSQSNVSYLQLIQQVAQQPFDTSLIRIQSQNAQQVTQILNITKSDANGQQFTEPLITQNYFSAYQQQSGILDIPYALTVDGTTEISTTILGTSTPNVVSYTFFAESKVNLIKPLLGKSAITKYATPNVPTAMVLAGGRPNMI